MTQLASFTSLPALYLLKHHMIAELYEQQRNPGTTKTLFKHTHFLNTSRPEFLEVKEKHHMGDTELLLYQTYPCLPLSQTMQHYPSIWYLMLTD